MSASRGTPLRAAGAKRKFGGNGPQQDRRHAIAAQGDNRPREETMRQLVQTSFVLCALAVASPAQVEAPAVPVEKVPFHVPVFRNEHVLLVNVQIPPGRAAGYHIHSLDQISVLVADADMAGQVLGGEPTPPRRGQRGNV